MTITEYKTKLLFVHYHLNEEKWFLPIMKEASLEKLEHMYAETDYQVVCYGHQHMVQYFRSQSKVFFNPGSLGCYHLPLARYGMIRVNENETTEELLEVPYDNKQYLKSYKKLQVPEWEFILKAFLGGSR